MLSWIANSVSADADHGSRRNMYYIKNTIKKLRKISSYVKHIYCFKQDSYTLMGAIFWIYSWYIDWYNIKTLFDKYVHLFGRTYYMNRNSTHSLFCARMYVKGNTVDILLCCYCIAIGLFVVNGYWISTDA